MYPQEQSVKEGGTLFVYNSSPPPPERERALAARAVSDLELQTRLVQALKPTACMLEVRPCLSPACLRTCNARVAQVSVLAALACCQVDEGEGRKGNGKEGLFFGGRGGGGGGLSWVCLLAFGRRQLAFKLHGLKLNTSRQCTT